MPELKFGRLPGKIPVGLKDLTFYSAGALPATPAKVVVPEVADWMMLGNDSHGDCGVAGLEHGFMADAAATYRDETFPTDQQAIDYYTAYDNGQDVGVVLSEYLAHVRQHGYYDNSVKAYAPFQVHDIPTLHFAVWAYDFSYTGIRVTQGMMNAFAAGKPWDLDDMLSDTVGGHCIPIVGYDSAYLYAVTWGRVQAISYSAWHFMSDEAWAVITGELVAADTDGRGISLAALEADLNKLAA